MEERGVYRHPARARQLLLFDGMQYGNITPTDIDATIEYKDRARIFVEVKGKSKDVPTGQRLLLQRFVDDFRASGKDAIAIIAEHTLIGYITSKIAPSEKFIISAKRTIPTANGESRTAHSPSSSSRTLLSS